MRRVKQSIKQSVPTVIRVVMAACIMLSVLAQAFAFPRRASAEPTAQTCTTYYAATPSPSGWGDVYYADSHGYGPNAHLFSLSDMLADDVTVTIVSGGGSPYAVGYVTYFGNDNVDGSGGPIGGYYGGVHSFTGSDFSGRVNINLNYWAPFTYQICNGAPSTYLQYIRQTDALSTYNWLSGSGYNIAVIDSGINASHPTFSGRIPYQYDFVNSDSTADDVDGHGTKVAGIIADVCPSCGIIPLKVSLGWDINSPSQVSSALDWVIANRVTYNIVAVNISASSTAVLPININNPLGQFQTLRQAGVVVVAAAGNEYFSYQQPGVGYPAGDSNVLAVGAVFHDSVGRVEGGGGDIAFSTAPNQIAPFSRRHGTLTPLFAPGGSDLPSADYASSGAVAFNGTSAAAPIVAATVGLVQHAAYHTYSRKWSADEVINVMLSSGVTILDAYPTQVDNVTHTNSQFKRVDVLAAVNSVLATTAAWNIGNYIQDGSMENDTVWDNTPWGNWASGSPFAHARKTDVPWTSTNSGALCGSYLRSATKGNLAAIGMSQPFMWYGGDMYISFALRTNGNIKVYPYITTPFGEDTALTPNTNTSMPSLPTTETVSSFDWVNTGDVQADLYAQSETQIQMYPITATGSNWQIYTAKISDATLGNYTFGLVAKGNYATQFAIDCLMVSEIGYATPTYNYTPLDAPTARGAVEQRSKQYLSLTTGNLITNADPLSAPVSLWLVPPATKAIIDKAWAVAVPKPKVFNSVVSKYPSIASGSGRIKNRAAINKRIIRVTTTQDSVLGDLGDLTSLTSLVSNVGKQLLIISFITDSVNKTPICFENIDTEECYTANDLSFTPYADTALNKHYYQAELPPGRYRTVMIGDESAIYYLDKVCVSTDNDFIVSASCSLSDLDVLNYKLNPQQVWTQSIEAQRTAIARATTGAYSTATAAAQLQNMQATVTQAYANGSVAQQQTAVARYNAALTATPAAAIAGTQFVQSFNATNTQIASNRLTQSAGGVVYSNMQTAQAATQSVVRTQQAAAQATLWGQATANAQLTQQPAAQATLVQNSTSIAQQQPTVNYVGTQARATQNAAATQYASAPNATNAALATQYASQLNAANAVATANAQAQATANAQLTQQAQTIATVNANAATVVAYQPTLQATVQMAGTQQVLQQPPTQPDFSWDANCNKPDNALNLAWWIDYEPCRILAWFSWSPVNTAQLTNMGNMCTDFEPCGTFGKMKGAIDKFMFMWPLLAIGDGQMCVRKNAEPGEIFRTATGFMNGTELFSIDVVDTGAFDQTCTLAIEPIIGSQMKKGVCISLNFLCYYGLLPFFSWAVNFATIVLLLFYIKTLRGRIMQ